MLPQPADAEFDVVLAGQVFFDLIFTGLDSAPAPGTEVWTSGLGSSPGGIANLAVAASRLGLRASLAAAFGDDAYGDWCRQVLSEQEGVDLSRSRRVDGLGTPVTVSITERDDRSMVTHGDGGSNGSSVSADDLLTGEISSRVAIADLNGMRGADADATWWKRAADRGTRIFADIGWDSTGAWDPRDLEPLASCYAFTPNSGEATAYTRTDDPIAAARKLAELVPLVVVTCGADGAVAIDSTTGEEARVPSVPVDLVDATGAGDVFGAAFVLGTLREWPLEQRLAFSALCSALAVQQLGGSLGAPGWAEIDAWWQHTRSAGDEGLARRYGFLTDVLPRTPATPVRRAEPTFRFPARRSPH